MNCLLGFIFTHVRITGTWQAITRIVALFIAGKKKKKKATCKQTTKKQKSTYKTSEWGKRNIPGGLKARTVLRSTEV